MSTTVTLTPNTQLVSVRSVQTNSKALAPVQDSTSPTGSPINLTLTVPPTGSPINVTLAVPSSAIDSSKQPTSPAIAAEAYQIGSCDIDAPASQKTV